MALSVRTRVCDDVSVTLCPVTRVYAEWTLVQTVQCPVSYFYQVRVQCACAVSVCCWINLCLVWSLWCQFLVSSVHSFGQLASWPLSGPARHVTCHSDHNSLPDRVATTRADQVVSSSASLCPIYSLLCAFQNVFTLHWPNQQQVLYNWINISNIFATKWTTLLFIHLSLMLAQTLTLTSQLAFRVSLLIPTKKFCGLATIRAMWQALCQAHPVIIIW